MSFEKIKTIIVDIAQPQTNTEELEHRMKSYLTIVLLLVLENWMKLLSLVMSCEQNC